MSPTLMVLAAGMGSRYGGLKQLDPMGPAGETILDYSVFDALRAGFRKVVFVIRRDFEKEFREKLGQKFESRTDVHYVFQQLDRLPAKLTAPPEREKPWGTTHAIWCAADAVKEPFAAINADDFYGADAYRKMGDFLQALPADASRPTYAMVGFRLDHTLSEHGTVSRGICEIDGRGFLRKIAERTAIARAGDGAEMKEANGEVLRFSGAEPVSMNFWGFDPSVFPFLEAQLVEFIKTKSGEAKSECYIPNSVAEIIERDQADVRVLETDSAWFGVTYREDKPGVVAGIREQVKAGTYPEPVWS